MFCVCADESHLFDIEDELMDVADRWKRIGRALRLRPPTLNQIEADQRNVADRLSAVLENWVKKNYDVERAGEPTWTLLVRADVDTTSESCQSSCRRRGLRPGFKNSHTEVIYMYMSTQPFT